jgi:hypothetical protein
MTTFNISIGTIVYVHWYGKLLQGTVINDHDLMGMVAVRIPIQGVEAIALFTPGHVYASTEEAQQARAAIQQQKPAATIPAAGNVPDRPRPLPAPSTKATPSETWQAIQKFKQEHWDADCNHLRIDALEEFYQLWRAAIAAKYGVTIETSTIISVDPGSPDGDHSFMMTVDTETGKIVQYAAALPKTQSPIVTEERYQQLKEKMKVKLTRQQLRSTGRIQYTDSIQTSLFD